MSTEDIPDSKALFEHLTKVLLRIVKDRPDDAFSKFESFSAQVKADAAEAAKVKDNMTATRELESLIAAKAKRISAHQQTLNLIKAPKKEKAEGDEGDEPEEEEEKENVPIPDIQAQHSILNRIGVNFGAEEAYKLSLSIQALANKNELADVKFWGKILGTQKDYYICEAKLEEYPEVEDPDPTLEAMGSGANDGLYYVCNSLQSQVWTKLPPVLPIHIKSARLCKTFFTGNLDAPVMGFPRFPWSETAYLRAQIARITMATSIQPAGLFNIDAEDPEAVPEPNEEYKAKHVLLMDDPKNWVHAKQGLLMIGRCTQQGGEEEEEEDEDAGPKKQKTPEELEKPVRRLRSIAEDVYENSSCWSLSVTPNPLDKFAAVSVASNVWPGARTAMLGGTAVSCYIGWGHKAQLNVWQPPAPPVMQPECKDDPPLELEDNQPPPEWVAPSEEAYPDTEGDDDDTGAAAAEKAEEGEE